MNKRESLWVKARKEFRILTKGLPIKLVDEDPNLSEMRNLIDNHSDDVEIDPFEAEDWISVYDYSNIHIIKRNIDDYTIYNIKRVNKINSEDRVENYIRLDRSTPFKDDTCRYTYEILGDSFKKTMVYRRNGESIEEVKYYDLEGNMTTLEDINNKPNSKALAR